MDADVWQPRAHIQVTPLIDVLLVLLVLGVLAWAGHRAGAQGASAAAAPTSEFLQGLSLPLRSGTQVSPLTAQDPLVPLIGLGLHGQLSWRDVPVTRDMLQRRLRETLLRDSRTEVWLAVDQAMPYADLVPWLEWLQAQQVTRVTLLSRSPASAPVSGKP